jgi:hypothetical protein
MRCPAASKILPACPATIHAFSDLVAVEVGQAGAKAVKTKKARTSRAFCEWKYYRSLAQLHILDNQVDIIRQLLVDLVKVHGRLQGVLHAEIELDFGLSARGASRNLAAVG